MRAFASTELFSRPHSPRLYHIVRSFRTFAFAFVQFCGAFWPPRKLTGGARPVFALFSRAPVFQFLSLLTNALVLVLVRLVPERNMSGTRRGLGFPRISGARLSFPFCTRPPSPLLRFISPSFLRQHPLIHCSFLWNTFPSCNSFPASLVSCRRSIAYASFLLLDSSVKRLLWTVYNLCTSHRPVPRAWPAHGKASNFFFSP